MATDVERLVVALEARTKAFENALNRANGVANRQARAIEKRFASLNKSVSADFAGLGRGLVAGFAGGAVARELVRLSESATRIDNSLKVAGLSGAELERVYQGLAKAAKENGAPIETLAALYGKAAQAQKELGVSTEELLGFTNNVALALRVAGTDAQTASGALLQLGQALGSGKVQAEEFNSILEGAPTIAQAVAVGLQEAGGSVSQLKQLIVDGQISSEAFFRAFEAGSVILEEKAANATFTVAQATTNLWNSLTDVVREFNNSTGAGERFAQGINNVASAVDNFDVSGLIQKIRDADTAFRDFLANDETLNAVLDTLNRLSGTTNAAGNVINVDKEKAEDDVASLEREVQLLQERIKLNTTLGFDNSEAIARLNEVQAKLAEVRAAAAAMPDTVEGYRVGESGIEAVPEAGATSLGGPRTRGGKRKAKAVETVSVADFKPPPSSGGGGGRRRGGGGGGGSGENEFQREIEQIKERTAAVQAETAAMSQVNPLLDDYGYAIEFARSKQDLLTAAQEAGLKVTPELEAQITQLATGYANASASADRLAQSQDQARQAADFLGDAAFDAFSDLIPQIETGNKALDKFLNTLIEAVAQSLLLGKGPLAGLGGGGGGGGLFGGLFSLFGFAKGGIAANGLPRSLPRFANGGISRSAAIFGEAGPEAAVPLPDGRRIPVDLRVPSVSKAGATNETITINLSADPSVIAEVADQRIETASGTIVQIAVAESNRQVMPTVAKYQQNTAGGDYRNG
ncbi:tape measure protein [Sinorhizobium sp. CCBAU 05631]|uniref:tape measure protein n=1 Tax=Sinorhizobium sp. CCBAU 05631 TaxID=794846 RepID=UPI0004ACE47F|nr:tape measure protein [Sinorhizobium sp. CCBAU 05631]ASY56494.1 putative tail length tape measure protein [Sinorhizobium sp. CCBAU 05631]